MSKQRKIGEVFLDELTGKRLKCVEDDISGFACDWICFYSNKECCMSECISRLRDDKTGVYFVETDELLTTE
jgi:hypothetical protein